MNAIDLRKNYLERYKEMEKIVPVLKEHIEEIMKGINIKIDQISIRIKEVNSFLKKAEKRIDQELKYKNPFSEIQDQIGVRVVVFFAQDVVSLSNTIKDYFTFIEEKEFPPDSYKEFAYEGRHYIINLSNDLIPEGINKNLIPDFFEIQIKTLYQHAWAQAEHDIGYKQNRELSFQEKRLMAFAAAQSWGADQIFMQILNNNCM